MKSLKREVKLKKISHVEILRESVWTFYFIVVSLNSLVATKRHWIMGANGLNHPKYAYTQMNTKTHAHTFFWLINTLICF